MAEEKAVVQDTSLETILEKTLGIPGVKVNRKTFLAMQFGRDKFDLPTILDVGPVAAGCPREMLKKKASNLILSRTSKSSFMSFAAGLPGGLAMAVSIPADVMQFFAMTLHLAQELVYLYGGQDLWDNGEIDSDAVKNQMVLYCGVMFGVSGAAAGVRLLSTQIAKTMAKKLPQKALTKTVWFPIVKQICKAIGVKATKTTVANGISKAIPVIGGVISGGLNFASMMPMGNRLAQTLDEAAFDYTEEEMLADYKEITEIAEQDEEEKKVVNKEPIQQPDVFQAISRGVSGGLQQIGAGISGLFGKKPPLASVNQEPQPASENPGGTEVETPDTYDALVKLLKLKEMGIITEEEFEAKKKELLSRI